MRSEANGNSFDSRGRHFARVSWCRLTVALLPLATAIAACGCDDSSSSTGTGGNAGSSGTAGGAGTGGNAGVGGAIDAAGGAPVEGGIPCGQTVCRSGFYCTTPCDICCPMGALCRCPSFDAGGAQ